MAQNHRQNCTAIGTKPSLVLKEY